MPTCRGSRHVVQVKHHNIAPPETADQDTKAWASQLGVSREAVELYRSSETFDLHVDSFIWTRVFGYDLLRDNGLGPTGGRVFGQLDVPRGIRSGLATLTWSITTNPFRGARARRAIFFQNMKRIRSLLQRADGVELVRDAGGVRRARAAGKQAALLAIQGADALEEDLADFRLLADSEVVRCTLVGFTNSAFGRASGGLPRLFQRGERGLTRHGHDLVDALNDARIAVDLAHASRETFDDAVRAHDRSLPFVVSHAGVHARHPHPRNLTGGQLRLLADFGGVVGIIFKPSLLCAGPASAATIAEHIIAVIDAVGDDFVAIGSDWDGVMTPPRDVPTPRFLPRVVQHLLDRGITSDSVAKVLGGNAMRLLEALRPGDRSEAADYGRNAGPPAWASRSTSTSVASAVRSASSSR